MTGDDAVIYLSGGINEMIAAACGPTLGLLLQPAKGNRPIPGVPWAADNDCFSPKRAFDDGRWLAYLARLRPSAADCLFATAPDVVGDAEATLARSTPYLAVIRELGYPVAFVTQDGCTSRLVPWERIDRLFVGGSTAWKFSESSVTLIREATRRRIPTHVGRVNSLRRMMTAHAIGAESVDGTHLAFRPKRYLPQVVGWLAHVNAQMTLEAVS